MGRALVRINGTVRSRVTRPRNCTISKPTATRTTTALPRTPDAVERLKALLERYKEQGYSRAL